MLGRVFTAADDQRGCGSPGVVISHAFWQREYGAAPDIIGRKLTLGDDPFEIIGVTPPDFFGLEVWKWGAYMIWPCPSVPTGIAGSTPVSIGG
jgi:hypothetical protein